MIYSRIPNIERMTSLKVCNLSNQTTPEDLKRIFEKYGDVGDVHVPRHPNQKWNQGFAFVRFYDCRNAEAAMDSLAGHILDGRKLRVQMATNSRRMQSTSRSRSRSRSHSRSRRSCSCSREHRSSSQIRSDSCHCRDDRRSGSCSCSRSHTRIVSACCHHRDDRRSCSCSRRHRSCRQIRSDSCHHKDDRRSRSCSCSRRHRSCRQIRSDSCHHRDDRRSRSCSCSRRHRSCRQIRSDCCHHRDDRRSRSCSCSRRHRSCRQIRSDSCHHRDKRFTSLLCKEIRESSEPRSGEQFDAGHRVPENSKLADSSSDLTSAESSEEAPNHSGNGSSVSRKQPLEIGARPPGKAPLKLIKWTKGMTLYRRQKIERERKRGIIMKEPFPH